MKLRAYPETKDQKSAFRVNIIGYPHKNKIQSEIGVIDTESGFNAIDTV
jgi:hypothetical protein